MQKQLKDIVKKKFNIKNYNNRYNRFKSTKIRFVGTFKKTFNNFFITLMNRKGEVILTQSAGNCKIYTKKKKRSFDTVKTLATSIAKQAVLKNIKFLDRFYITHSYLKNMFLINNSFKLNGLIVGEVVYIKKKIHGLPLRKRKIRRI